MATMHWGRKETIIFPPHGAVYTYGAVFFAVILTGLFVYLRFTFGNTPLQRFYTPIYIRSSVAGGVSASRKDKYRLVMIGARGIRPRPATDADVTDGNTPEPGTKPLPLALSQSALQAGYDLLYQDPERTYIDAPLSAYLKSAIYGGDSLSEIYQLPLFFGLLSLLIQLPFSIRKDIKRRKQMRYGRRLKGTERLTPKEFNRKVQGEGLGIKIDGLKEMLRIPAKAEAQHVQIIADTGGGKTTIIMQMLRQIRSRGDSAIVYDPALEYTRRFYDPKHDIILNPLDRRCPYWGPAEELRTSSEADAIAVSLFQPPQDKKGEFFFEIPQQIFAYLLRYGPTPEELIEWMSNPKEIDNRVARTEVANFIDAHSAPATSWRVGVSQQGGKEPSALAAQRCWQRRVDRNRVVGNTPGMDLHHLASSRARGASSTAKRMDRHARAPPPERTESTPETGLVCARRAGQLAASSPVSHRPHREPQKQQSHHHGLSGEGSVGSDLRPPGGGHAIDADDQHFPENQGAECRRVGQQGDRQSRNRAHEGKPLRRNALGQKFRAGHPGRAGSDGIRNLGIARPARLHQIRELRHGFLVSLPRYRGASDSIRAQTFAGREAHLRSQEHKGESPPRHCRASARCASSASRSS